MLWLQINGCSLQLSLSGTAAGYQYSSREMTVLFYFLLLVVSWDHFPPGLYIILPCHKLIYMASTANLVLKELPWKNCALNMFATDYFDMTLSSSLRGPILGASATAGILHSLCGRHVMMSGVPSVTCHGSLLQPNSHNNVMGLCLHPEWWCSLLLC